jgi:predicted nucleotidyltransferase
MWGFPHVGVVRGNPEAVRAGIVDIISRALKITVELGDFGDVREVIIFGSAARPGDFVPGLSDVDVLVVTEGAPRRRSLRFYHEIGSYEVRVEATLYSVDEIERLAEEGSTLIHMLRYSIQVYVRGDSVVARLKPRITDHTLQVLRRSTLAALGLALQAYFYGEYRRSVHHTYHSIRHLIRYEVAREGKQIPISDGELLEVVGADTKDLVLELIELRRADPGEEEALKYMVKVLERVASRLKLVAPSLEHVVRAHRDSRVVDANICEEEGGIAVKLMVVSGVGTRTLKHSVDGVEEVESILCI